MPRPGQWRLTDLQRLFLALAVVTAVFLSAMALGERNIALLLVALLLLVVAGVAVFLLGLWYSSKRQVPGGMAYVISSSAPPAGAIVGRCDMRLLIDLADGGTKMIKLRDPAVSVTKWPRPGMVLPFEVDERNPRIMRVRWDRVNPNQPRGADDPFTETAPFHTEYAEDAAPAADDRYAGHTPPAHAASPAQAGQAAPPAQPAPGQTPVIVDDGSSYTPAFLDPAMDLVEPLIDFSDAPVDDPLQTPLVDDPFVEDPFVDDEPTEDSPPLPPSAATDGEVANVEAESTGEASAARAGFEVPALVPRPRDREPDRQTPSLNGASPPPGMGVLQVADFTRSLGFYRDVLGFEVVDHTPDLIVLAYSGGKHLELRPQVETSPPVNLRVIHVNIEVPDLQAAYEQLRAKGVGFAHEPRVLSRGAKLELWAARFRDPDQHGIALTEWRQRHAPRA